jgi:hypothetical protein
VDLGHFKEYREWGYRFKQRRRMSKEAELGLGEGLGLGVLDSPGAPEKLALTMNLNCFQYIMTVGWLSFLVQPQQEPEESEDDEEPKISSSSTAGGNREIHLLKLLEDACWERDDLKLELSTISRSKFAAL